MSRDRSAGQIATEMMTEAEREGVLALSRVSHRRKELAKVVEAAATGQLIDRPLSAAERMIVRDALAFTWACVSVGNIRDTILGPRP